MHQAQAEALMLARDAQELSSFALGPLASQSGGVLGLGAPPFLCFFVVEAYDWLRRNQFLTAQAFLESEASRVRELRSRLKLFDERRGFAAAVDRLGAVERASTRMFQDKHRGILGSLGRWLQQDLGFFFVGPDLICSTHVGMGNLGLLELDSDPVAQLSVSALGEEARAFAQNLGRFLGSFLRLPGLEPEDPGRAENAALPGAWIAAEDHKAAEVYARISGILGVVKMPLSAPFISLVSQVNYVHVALRPCFSPESDLFFRFRFLTAFHALQALKTLGAVLRGDRSNKVGQLVAEIQSRPGARGLRNMKALRNAMAHYDAEGARSPHSQPGILDQVIKNAYGDERSALSALLDEELEAMSRAFRGIVAKGTLGGVPVSLLD